jgi:hypothetical protein
MMNIPVRVRHLVAKLDETDPYRIAQAMHLDIVLYDLPPGVNGLWRRILRRKYIVINEHLNNWQRRAVICHELAHFRCHHGYKSYSISGRTWFSSSTKEREANEFAVCLMSYGCDVRLDYVRDFLENGWKMRSFTDNEEKIFIH